MGDEELADVAEQDGPAGKKGLPLVLIVIIVAVVVGAVGFFAGKMISGGGNVNDDVKVEDKKQKDENSQAENKGGKETSTDADKDKDSQEKSGSQSDKTEGGKDDPTKPGILVLEEFTVNLNDPFGRRYGKFNIKFEVEQKRYIEKIKSEELLMPRIRDEIFMILSAKSYNELKSTSGKMTLKEEIIMRVNERINEMLELEPITNVYFTEFLIQ